MLTSEAIDKNRSGTGRIALFVTLGTETVFFLTALVGVPLLFYLLVGGNSPNVSGKPSSMRFSISLSVSGSNAPTR